MRFFTTFDGLRLAFRDEGEGLAVLCLPGLTRDSRDFDYLAPHLSDVRLIRPDYRGRGASQWAEDPMSYTVPVEARDVLALMDHLGLERAAIIGTSRGGLIGMTLAASARERLIGVCLNDIGPEIGQQGLEVIMGYLGRNPRFRTQAGMAEALPGLMEGFRNVPHERWVQEVERHTAVTPEGLRITYDPRLREAVEAAGAQPAPDLWPLFDALEGLPLALIRGEGSTLLTRETAERMRARRPDMIFAEVPDRGHVPFLDEPEALAAIRAWLEKCQ